VKESGASIYTPCAYEIDECSYLGSHDWSDPSQLVSFRGKFTEQVGDGDRVEARGTLERVEYGDRTACRVMLGGKGDYLVPATLLDR
jgi:predicted nucleotidyltransferase